MAMPAAATRNTTVTLTYDPSVIANIRQYNRNLAADFQNLMWVWNYPHQGVTIPSLLATNERLIFDMNQALWIPASEKHVMFKARHGYDTRTLRMTNRMYRAATIPGSADNVSFGDANNYYYGVNAENFRDSSGVSYPETHNTYGHHGVVRRFVYLLQEIEFKIRALFGAAVRDRMQMRAGQTKLRGIRFGRKTSPI
jgi:hypothetical protein